METREPNILWSWRRRLHAMVGVFYGVMLEYRAELALWAVATSIPLIMMGVWAELSGQGGDLPLDRVTLIRYFIAVFVVRQLTIVWVIYDFEWHVVSGRLSPMLLQPVNPHWRFVTAHFAEQAAKIPFTLIVLGLCFFLYPHALFGDAAAGSGAWLPGWGNVALAWLFCVWAFAVRYLIQNVLAILAFWVERVVSLEQIVFLPYLYLSGMLAPLEVFPAWARELALLTPLPYTVWLPAMLLVGAEALPIGQAVVVLAVWTVILAAVNRVMWGAGLKRYSAMGA